MSPPGLPVGFKAGLTHLGLIGEKIATPTWYGVERLAQNVMVGTGLNCWYGLDRLKEVSIV